MAVEIQMAYISMTNFTSKDWSEPVFFQSINQKGLVVGGPVQSPPISGSVLDWLQLLLPHLEVKKPDWTRPLNTNLMQTFPDQTTFCTSPNTQCSHSSKYRHLDINGWCNSTPTVEMPNVSPQKHMIALVVAFDLHSQSSYIYIFNLWSPTFVPTSVQWRYSTYLLPSLIVAYSSQFCAMKMTWSCLSSPPYV